MEGVDERVFGLHCLTHRPSMGGDVAPKNPAELLPGTLDMLVLRTLVRAPQHGYGIAERVKELSRDVFQVGESSLYPALQRLLLDGYVRAEWGTSENNRRARYYTLTPAGRRQLAAERKEFERVVTAIQAILEFA
jgi:transcriptional regulator